MKTEILLGKTIAEAKKITQENGLLFRVTQINDVYYPITMDLRTDRINVQIENEVVVFAKIY